MKRKIQIQTIGSVLLSLFLGAILAVSCDTPDHEMASATRVNPSSPIFHATVEDADASTKVFTDANLHVLWNADDLISIFAKTTRNKKYRFKGMNGATGGDFEEIVTGDFGTGADIDHNYAVYPYDERTGYVFDDIVRAYFPRTQAYLENSFGRGANLMVAKSGNTDLSFKNVGGYLCFKLYGSSFSVRSIILKGNAGENLSGPVKISFGTGNIPAMAFDAETPAELTQEIVLKADAPVALGSSEADATHFWMVVPPVHFASGFTVTIIDSEGGIHEQSTSKDITIERSRLFKMKAFEVKAVTPVTLEQGLYPFSGASYVYNKQTDQVNIVEAEGNAWVRFLQIPSLSMYELGPIPLDAVAGDVVDATLANYVNGTQLGTPLERRLTVQSIDGGIMKMVSDEGDRYVFRF